MKKRFISAVIIAMMLTSILPCFATAACVVTNVTTGQEYGDFNEAVNSAKQGETLKLCADATSGVTVISSGVTVDLNGHKLSASYVVAFKNSAIIDTNVTDVSGLYVPYNNLTLGVNNPQVAIFDSANGCFIFVDYSFDDGNKHLVMLDGNTYYTGPRFAKPNSVARTRANALLAKNSADTGVQFIIRLEWKTTDYDVSQDYFYNADDVENIFSSPNSKIFYAIFAGDVLGEGVSVTTVIKSKGAEYKSEKKERT